MPIKVYTLIFINFNGRVLLGYKKRGFGHDTWNGYGGKLKENENTTDGAIRELFEESNLSVKKGNLKYLGVVTFSEDQLTRVVHVFTSSRFQGELKESEEMRPRWFDVQDLPYDKMLPDSQLWVPLVLRDQYFKANFTYVNNELFEQSVEELSSPPEMIETYQEYNLWN